MNCHMCQTVSSSHNLANCSQCPKLYCIKCVKLHLINNKTDPKNSIKQQLESILKNKSWVCFSCNKKCKCQMCSSGRAGLMGFQTKNKMRNMNDLNIKEMDKIQIFKNEDISQLPIYLQQMWMNKYALYKNKSFNQKQNSVFEVQSQQEQNNEPAQQLQNQSFLNANDNQRDDINMNMNSQFQNSNMEDAQNQNENENQKSDNLQILPKPKRRDEADQNKIKKDANEQSISVQNKQNELSK